MALPEKQLQFFAEFIQKELGIVFSSQNYFQLEQRLEKICQITNIANPDELYKKAIGEGITGTLKQVILDIATNNETSFFRDAKVFKAIADNLFPSFAQTFPKAANYRVWSAAASFGQEPFSLAMLAYEHMLMNPTKPRFELISTDIATHALDRCNEAKYSQLEIQRGLSAERMVKYFTKTDDSYWILNQDIKKLVSFRRQNLLEPFLGLGQFHLICCRYVLIYQDHEKKKEILARIIKCLVPGGYLVLGGSESALGLSDEITQVMLNGAVFYQKKQ